MASQIEPSSLARAHARPAGFWAALDRWRERCETVITGGLFGASMVLVLYTILMRYFVPVYTPHYTDEVTVYLTMWAVLLACGSVTHRREHVHGDLIVHRLPRPLQRWIEILANLVGTAFAIFLAYYGWQVTHEAWSFGDLSPTNLRFPLWIYDAALPVAAVLMAIGHVRVAVDLWRRKPGHAESSAQVD